MPRQVNGKKHVDIRAHYVRQYVEDGTVKIFFVKSENNSADSYTKNVSSDLYKRHALKSVKPIDQK